MVSAFKFLPKIKFPSSSIIDRVEGYGRKVQPTYIASTCFFVSVWSFVFVVRVLSKFFFRGGGIYMHERRKQSIGHIGSVSGCCVWPSSA